jgi:hypothetical protein
MMTSGLREGISIGPRETQGHCSAQIHEICRNAQFIGR